MGPVMALVLLGCAPKRPVQVDKGLTPATTTLEALQQARAPRREAVVIGVDRYGDPTFPPLRHADDDARDLGARLASPEVGGFDHVTVLTDAARAPILDALRELRDTLRRDDVLIVYFSGHGTRARDAEGRWRRYLVPADAAAGDLAGTALDLADLQAFFASLAPLRKALVVDACFDGEGRSVVADPGDGGPLDSLVPTAAGLGPGEAYLFATSPGRPAREDDSLGHGVYTFYWLEALSWGFGDADVDRDHVLTAWEIHDYARGRTIEHTDGAEVPEAAFRVVGEGDLVVAGDPDPRKRADRALVYLYPTTDDPWTGASLLVDGREKGALPGTVPVQPGRHHVLVRGADGAVRVDGFMSFAGGRGYTIDEVARLAQGPSAELGVRSVALTGLTDALGPGAVGAEAYAADRSTGPWGRGFVVDGSLGAAVSPTRAATDLARPVAWLSGGAGWQGDLGRLRLRAGLGVTGYWVPPRFEDPRRAVVLERHPGEIGWIFAAAGPTASVGWVLGGGWTVTGSARPQVAWLDTDFDRRPEAVPIAAFAVGLEVDR